MMIHFLLCIFGGRRRDDASDEDTKKKVSQSMHRLETLTDRLESTTNALEELLIRLRKDEEVDH